MNTQKMNILLLNNERARTPPTQLICFQPHLRDRAVGFQVPSPRRPAPVAERQSKNPIVAEAAVSFKMKMKILQQKMKILQRFFNKE